MKCEFFGNNGTKPKEEIGQKSINDQVWIVEILNIMKCEIFLVRSCPFSNAECFKKNLLTINVLEIL